MWNSSIKKKTKNREASRFKDYGGYEREVWSVLEGKGGKMEG